MNQGRSIPKETFQKLKDLYERSIDHEAGFFLNGKGFIDTIGLEENENLAELVGIILGDGHLHEDKENGVYYISVTLHEDENHVIERTRELLEKTFGKRPSRYSNNKFKSIQLRLEDKISLIELKNCGLESGNKVEKQVGVPSWIKEDKKYAQKCLKGLLDTDGTIYRRKHEDYYVAQFKNHSYKLLSDFEAMCELIEVQCSKAGEYQIQVASQEELRKFIDQVNPIKAEKPSLEIEETLLKS